MKVSINWLKEYVAISIPAEKFAQKLTMAGLEVEKISHSNGDTVFELEITPNRPDCLSVLGIARETAAILNKKRIIPKTKKRTRPKKKCAITIDGKKDCPRYIGAVVENITVKKAQDKIIKHLGMLEIRPVNNIVDITNFCLMESGQPLHAFDYDKLSGGKIIVRRAHKGESIVTIDNIERKLDPSILVIADDKRPVAIAGIMGGKNSEVTNSTKNILLECAYFDPVLIRRASRKLGLGSESSYRFERGIDVQTIEGASLRAIDLILEHAQGQLTMYNDCTAGQSKKAPAKIFIPKNMINERTGASLTSAQCRNILTKLDFHVTAGKSGGINVTPPSFREDVSCEPDIIEEISRIVGYDNLPMSTPKVNATNIVQDPKRNTRHTVRGIMIAQGFNEVITYTMINRKCLAQSNQSGLSAVSILNPLTQDQEMMRPSMLPSLLSIVNSNINRGQKNIKFFEVGKIYTAKGEKDTLGIIMTGLRNTDWRQLQKEHIDYYDIKGIVEQIYRCINITNEKICFQTAHDACFAPGQGAVVEIEGKVAGTLGKIEDNVLNQWDIKQQGVYYAQIDFDSIYRRGGKQDKYQKVSEFPVISRDISLAVKSNISAQDIEQAIRKTANGNNDVILADVKFIELYEGKKISRDQRGLIFSLTYQSRLARTLRDEEVEAVHSKVCRFLIDELGAVQR